MNDLQKDIEMMRDPKNIREAVYASGPSVLMRAFERDPTVERLVRAGSGVVPLISAEIKKNDLKLDPITLSCFAYILQKVDPAPAARILAPLFIRAMDHLDPFFVYFAAHALRQELRLSFRPGNPEYTFGELLETRAWVERTPKLIRSGKDA